MVPVSGDLLALANRELVLDNPEYRSRLRMGRTTAPVDRTTGLRVPIPQKVTCYQQVNGFLVLPRESQAAREAMRGGFVDARSDGYPSKFLFKGSFQGHWAYQKSVVEKLAAAGGGILEADCGCHAAGQLVLMADGTRKKVEDIRVGDRVMGLDGSRTVLELHRGRQRMARIVPNKGEPFVVNVGHKLTVVWSVASGAHRDGDVFDISVAEWLTENKWSFQRHTMLYRPRVDSFDVSRVSNDRSIAPYHLGMLLGDGKLGQGSVCVTSADSEIVSECNALARQYGLMLRGDSAGGRRCPSYYFTTGVRGGGRSGNPLIKDLHKLGLRGARSGTKFIPHTYLTASRHDRLDLLAGLLDTDGSLSNGGFDWISKSSRLADDVVFLCRSLGLAAYVSRCVKADQYGTRGSYYRVSISGECSNIPTRIPRKKAPLRRINKDAQRVGFRVELLPEDSYYGFTVSGDHRYLLGDFTWTHNSGKTVMALALIARLGRSAFILVHTDELCDQWLSPKYGIERFLGIPRKDVAIIRGPRCDFAGKKIGIGTLQSISVKDYPEEFFAHWGVLISDECHRVGAAVWSKAVPRFPAKYRFGLTATVRRADGMDALIHAHVGPVVAKAEAPKIPVKVLVIPNRVMYVRDHYTTPWGQRRVNHPKLFTMLSESEARNKLLLDAVQDALEHGRRVLIVGARLMQLRALHDVFLQAKISSGLIIAETPKEDRERAKEKARVLCVVSQYGQEYLNVPEFDTLAMATPIPGDHPFAALKQIVGRVQRFVEGKKTPVVIDIVDVHVREMVRWWNNRKRWYRMNNYPIHQRTLEAAK